LHLKTWSRAIPAPDPAALGVLNRTRRKVMGKNNGGWSYLEYNSKMNLLLSEKEKIFKQNARAGVSLKQRREAAEKILDIEDQMDILSSLMKDCISR
jgi:hypothetical protein